MSFPAAEHPRPSPRPLLLRVEDAIAVVTALREEAVRAGDHSAAGAEIEEHLLTALRELHVVRHKVSRR